MRDGLDFWQIMQTMSGIVRSACTGAAALSILLSGVGCNEPSPANALSNWKPFSPPGGNFVVTMPPNPVEEKPQNITGYEETKYRIVSAMSNLAGLAIGYSDQPNTGVFQKEPNKILDAVMKTAIESRAGELISQTPIKLKKYPGREFTFSVKGGFTERHRIYVANKRLYSLMVITGSKGLNSPEATTFFDSFDILK